MGALSADWLSTAEQRLPCFIGPAGDHHTKPIRCWWGTTFLQLAAVGRCFGTWKLFWGSFWAFFFIELPPFVLYSVFAVWFESDCLSLVVWGLFLSFWIYITWYLHHWLWSEWLSLHFGHRADFYSINVFWWFALNMGFSLLNMAAFPTINAPVFYPPSVFTSHFLFRYKYKPESLEPDVCDQVSEAALWFVVMPRAVHIPICVHVSGVLCPQVMFVSKLQNKIGKVLISDPARLFYESRTKPQGYSGNCGYFFKLTNQKEEKEEDLHMHIVSQLSESAQQNSPIYLPLRHQKEPS